MDGPPAEFPTASGRASFTPCGDRRWRVAVDDEHVGELVESFQEGDTTWVLEASDGRVCPRRETWMLALTDIPEPV